MQERVRPPAPAVPEPPLTAQQFLAFWRTRPDDERWELIDGVPYLVTPPTPLHELIAHSLRDLLRDHLVRARPDLRVWINAGVQVPGNTRFRAMCDVGVIPKPTDLVEPYAKSFLVAAEVRSKSNTARKIERKRLNYIDGPDTLHVLVLQQKKLQVEHWARASGWQRSLLDHLDHVLDLPELGFSCTLRDIYRDTPLGS